MSDVFISYARETEAYAKKVAEALRAAGFGVWYDEDLPAHRAFSEVIEERLRAAKAVIVIWSADGVKSQWVRAEADTARKAGTLVQLRVDKTDLPLPFSQIQCVDLAGWSGDANTTGWRKIIASVEELVGRKTDGQPPAVTAVAARAWVTNRLLPPWAWATSIVVFLLIGTSITFFATRRATPVSAPTARAETIRVSVPSFD